MPSSQQSAESDTQSLTASVTDYPIEHGRRYHKYHEGLYPFPNDEQELDRLDMQHHLWKMVNNNRLYLAPLKDPKQILDIGTGTGIWPIELASVFPDATITGTDLSPIQPNEVPHNVHFIVEDATEPQWLWDDNHFDYVHMANMIGSLPKLKEVMRKVYKVLRPGGWFEWHEIDMRIRCDDGSIPPHDPDSDTLGEYAPNDWVDLSERAAHKNEHPRKFLIAHELADLMSEVGFVDVEDRVKKVPLNEWPEDPRQRNLGAWNERNWLDGLAAWSYKPFLTLGWSKPEIEVFLVSVRKCISDRKYHGYNNFHVVMGRKPLPGDSRASSESRDSR